MKISIIIYNQNGQADLPQCLFSCSNQTHQDLEIIVVDDGSIDTSRQLLDAYSKSDLRIIPLILSMSGYEKCISDAKRIARGDAIVCLRASDQLFNFSYLEKAEEYLRRNEKIDFASGIVQIFSRTNTFLGSIGSASGVGFDTFTLNRNPAQQTVMTNETLCEGMKTGQNEISSVGLLSRKFTKMGGCVFFHDVVAKVVTDGDGKSFSCSVDQMTVAQPEIKIVKEDKKAETTPVENEHKGVRGWPKGKPRGKKNKEVVQPEKPILL